MPTSRRLNVGAKTPPLEYVQTLPRIKYDQLPSKSTDNNTYFKEWLQYFVTNSTWKSRMLSGDVILATGEPNAQCTIIGRCYKSTPVNSSNMPQHSSFAAILYNDRDIIRFGTSNYSWYYSNPDDNTVTAYCSTDSGTAAKVVQYSGYKLRQWNMFVLNLINGNSYAGKVTLNVNGTGAKDLYINGSVSSSSNYNIASGTYFVVYNGTNYYLYVANKLYAHIVGHADSDLALTGGTITGALTVNGRLQAGSSSQSSAPTTGIAVHDIRNVADRTAGILSKAANFLFTNKNTPTTEWWSILHVHGWDGNYSSWELAGPSHNANQKTTPLYLRSGDTTNGWGSWRTIFDSAHTIPVANGGTGKTTHTANAVLTGDGTNAVKNVATASGALYATAANGAPAFGTLPAAQGGTGNTSLQATRNAMGLGNTTGALPVANGGTGATTITSAANNLLVQTLGHGTAIAEKANLNDITTLGNYYCNTSARATTLTNCPTKAAFTMKVGYATGNGYINQTIIEYHSGVRFYRVTDGLANPTWREWKAFYQNTNTVTGYCTTGADAAAKTASYSNFVLRDGAIFPMVVAISNTVKSKLTLNVNDTGAKDLWLNGAVTSDSNYSLVAGAYIVKYTGGVYKTYTSNKIDTDITGHADKDLALTGGTMSGNLNFEKSKGGIINANRIELTPGITTAGHGGYIDFHFNDSSADYTSRIIEDSSGIRFDTNEVVASSAISAVFTNAMIYSRSSNIDLAKSNNNVSSVAYPAFVLLDASKRIISRFESVVNPNGDTGFNIYSRNYDASGNMKLQAGISNAIDKNGNCSWSITKPEKFRHALYMRWLYSNDAGTTGTVTIAETAANFGWIIIGFRCNGSNAVAGPESGVMVPFPNGKYATLSAAYWATDAVCQLRSRTVLISGTSITTQKSQYVNFNSNKTLDFNNNSNAVYITRILGIGWD